MTTLENKLEELNLVTIPTYEEWIQNWLCSVESNGNIKFFSLLKSHIFWLDTISSWKKKNKFDKELIYKKWYNGNFLPSHFGITNND